MKCEICGKEILRDSQCINYKYYHNDCIENLQQENKKLNGSIQTYDILLKANVEENKRLKDNWIKLKECIKECLEAIDTIQTLTGNAIENYTPRILTYRQILDKMQKIEGSDSNE